MVAAPEEVRGQGARAHGQGSSDGDLSPSAGGQAGRGRCPGRRVRAFGGQVLKIYG